MWVSNPKFSTMIVNMNANRYISLFPFEMDIILSYKPENINGINSKYIWILVSGLVCFSSVNHNLERVKKLQRVVLLVRQRIACLFKMYR